MRMTSRTVRSPCPALQAPIKGGELARCGVSRPRAVRGVQVGENPGKQAVLTRRAIDPEPGEEHASSLLGLDPEALVLGHRGHAAGLSLNRFDRRAQARGRSSRWALMSVVGYLDPALAR